MTGRPSAPTTLSRRGLVQAGAVGALAACAATRRGASGRLRVMTWNIRHGRGGDGLVDLARTAAVIRTAAPDLVLLQEVDRGCGRSGGVDQPAVLGERCGMQAAFAAHRDFDGGEYGLALLARRPIPAARAVPLPDAPAPLVALEADVELRDGGALRVLCVHLVRTEAQRVAQARHLVARLDAHAGPALVAGDFNGRRESAVLAPFEGWTVALPGAPRETFPADDPGREIDFVVVRGAVVASAAVIPEPLASDHRPVLVDLELR